MGDSTRTGCSYRDEQLNWTRCFNSPLVSRSSNLLSFASAPFGVRTGRTWGRPVQSNYPKCEQGPTLMPIEVRDRDLERSMHILSAYFHRRTDTGGSLPPPPRVTETQARMVSKIRLHTCWTAWPLSSGWSWFFPMSMRIASCPPASERADPQYILRPQCTARLVTEQAVFPCAQLLSAMSIASMILFFHPQLK